jgi:hypothetical protein
MTGYQDDDPSAMHAPIEGALVRIETGQPLRPIDKQDLSLAFGRGAALRLMRHVDEERETARQAIPAKPRGWFTRSGKDAPDPLPKGLARLLLRIRSGRPLGAHDARHLARKVGKSGARRLERQLRRQPARTRRATHQKGRIR